MEHVAIGPQNTTSVCKVGHHLIPMARDFVYLAVMLDWATRHWKHEPLALRSRPVFVRISDVSERGLIQQCSIAIVSQTGVRFAIRAFAQFR
jgi:hypothetical protein